MDCGDVLFGEVALEDEVTPTPPLLLTWRALAMTI